MANISPGIAAKSVLCVNVPISGGFYQIDGVDDISGPSVSKTEIQVTGHTSDALEYVASPLYDAGTLDFGLFFNPANKMHNYLLDHAISSSSIVDTWMLIFNNGTKYAWSGSLLEFGISNGNPASDACKATAKVRITGTIQRNVSGAIYTNSGSLT
jgi:hypothetical protein